MCEFSVSKDLNAKDRDFLEQLIQTDDRLERAGRGIFKKINSCNHAAEFGLEISESFERQILQLVWSY